MSKKTKITTILIILVMTVIMATACTMGEKGLSAYDIAVKNGFVGTEAEWLESLRGDNGINGTDGQSLSLDDLRQLYNEEVSNGYSKDFYTFLQEKLGLDINANIDNAEIISKSMLSCVTINTVLSSGGVSGGSGVIYNLDQPNGNAIIVTNYHVVYDQYSTNNIGKEIKVMLRGQEYQEYQMIAQYIGGSMTYDLAVLSIENSEVIKNSNARAVTIDTAPTKVGGSAIAIGNPQGEGMAVTEGIVSVDSEYIDMVLVDNKTSAQMRVMRVDTAINKGNSGGGLFNAEGKLIGIVNAKIIKTGVEGVGYAIPASIVRSVVNNVLATCDGTNTPLYKPVLGIQAKIRDSKLAYNSDRGIYQIKETIVVDQITNNSLAYGKLQVGDVLVSINVGGVDKGIDRLFVVSDSLLDARVGQNVTIKVLRDGQQVDIVIPVEMKDMVAVK